MHKKSIILLTALMFGMGLIFASCVGVQVKPTAVNFKAPVITLESFEVPQYDGYWYYGGKTKPTKGKAGDHGAPLPMSFLFNVKNPNPYPILLDGYKFTVAFDEVFDLVTVNNMDSYWIPAGKTTHVRATTLITVRSGLLALLVTGGYKLKAKKISAWQALEKWWDGASGYAIPITVHEGAFTFKANGVMKILPFKATFK
ncbi:MAG: LEA type 2 family protein [Deltaproteobacteria bacterium]|nr:LEA type 2 family protein [Deltaproteobacteria bacterium]